MSISNTKLREISKMLGSSVKDDNINIEELTRNKLYSSQWLKNILSKSRKVILVMVDK